MLLTLCLYKRDDTSEMIKRYIKYKVASVKSTKGVVPEGTSN